VARTSLPAAIICLKMAMLIKGSSSSSSADWVETDAKIVSSEYKYARLRDIDFDASTDQSHFLNCFSYTVNGEVYVGDFESSSPHEVGQSIQISYNPSNPQENSWSAKTPTAIGRVVFWIVGIALTFLIIYLSRRFGWQE
jgi:hypothetical protein